MPLSPEIDRRIFDRFGALIKEGTELVAKMEEHNRNWHQQNRELPYLGKVSGHTSEYNALVVKSCNLIRAVFANSEHGISHQQRIEKLMHSSDSVEIIVGILRGLQDDYKYGFLNDLQERVIAEVSANYMGQAEALLSEGITGQYDHVPAAVLCGAVLENRLRHWCGTQTPPIRTTKSDGSNMTLGPLIEELRKTNKFDKQVLRQLQWWADIRNQAAHGEFDKFTRQEVELMLRGVDNFFVSVLGSASPSSG